MRKMLCLLACSCSITKNLFHYAVVVEVLAAEGSKLKQNG
jgi:hypothetical protein